MGEIGGGWSHKAQIRVAIVDDRANDNRIGGGLKQVMGVAVHRYFGWD